MLWQRVTPQPATDGWMAHPYRPEHLSAEECTAEAGAAAAAAADAVTRMSADGTVARD